VQSRILLARTHLLLDDTSAAHILISETRPFASAVSDATWLNEQLDDVRRQVRQTSGSSGHASTLTTAELRVLQYLPSHLSFEQISQRLFVSRNTVKTQAIAVYRKLNVSSRSDAVERARELGILSGNGAG
jgi:LuxR family maltose regulon positive regulatory protein